MDQKELALAGLAPAKGAYHSPIQVQKLFFLLDKNIPEIYGGPLFNFEPYNYGPFDKKVYQTLEELENEGLVDIDLKSVIRTYKLTELGQTKGDKVLSDLPEVAQKFMVEVSNYVRKLSFNQLVSAIYKAYPEMRVNSVFQG